MESVKDEKPLDEMEELYFDMDVSTVLRHDAMQGSHILSSSSESPEFEFTMSSLPGEYESADQLFFKGQLLPLLLPSRLQMVETLLASEQCDGQRSQAQEKNVSCSSLNSVLSSFGSGTLTFASHATPNHIKLHNLSSISQSSSGFWDSCDKDSAESSCRDSNGSSQDSCFSSKDMETREGYARGLEDSLNAADGKCENVQTSWLKIAFQWKLIFGSKKASNSKFSQKGTQKPVPDSQYAKPCISLQNGSLGGLAMAPFMAELYALEQPRHDARHRPTPFSCYSRRIYRALAGDGAQKQGDFWHRYLNPLKRLRGKVSDRGEQAWTEEESMAAKTLSSYFVGEPPFAKKPSCTSFLPASFRIPSFSRRASAPTSRISSSRSSPNHSGVLSPVDYATMVDIQSAVQGAIAHCKQSQAGSKVDHEEIHTEHNVS